LAVLVEKKDRLIPSLRAFLWMFVEKKERDERRHGGRERTSLYYFYLMEKFKKKDFYRRGPLGRRREELISIF